MEKNKKQSFVFYETYDEYINDLSTDAEKLEFLRAIIQYGLYGNEILENGPLKMGFRNIKALIDRSIANRGIKKANGKKGGRPKSSDSERVKEVLENKDVKQTILTPEVTNIQPEDKVSQIEEKAPKLNDKQISMIERNTYNENDVKKIDYVENYRNGNYTTKAILKLKHPELNAEFDIIDKI